MIYEQDFGFKLIFYWLEVKFNFSRKMFLPNVCFATLKFHTYFNYVYNRRKKIYDNIKQRGREREIIRIYPKQKFLLLLNQSILLFVFLAFCKFIFIFAQNRFIKSKKLKKELKISTITLYDRYNTLTTFFDF